MGSCRATPDMTLWAQAPATTEPHYPQEGFGSKMTPLAPFYNLVAPTLYVYKNNSFQLSVMMQKEDDR